MKKAMFFVFTGVVAWFCISNSTGIGKMSIYTVSDFIAPFYVQLGDIILYLLFGTLIYTSGIFIFHIYSFQQCRKVLKAMYGDIRKTIRGLFRAEEKSEDAGSENRAQRLWQIAKTDQNSMYKELFQGLGEDDLKSRQDFIQACEIRLHDISSQKKQAFSFYNYISITAPTLGFLGTAVGMVAIFDDVGKAGAEQMAADLKIALITTVVGLSIRFLALFCKTFLDSFQEDLSIAITTDLKEMLV